MDSYNHCSFDRSLQMEVDAYFLDTLTSSYTSIMTFWQVRCLYFHFSDLLVLNLFF